MRGGAGVRDAQDAREQAAVADPNRAMDRRVRRGAASACRIRASLAIDGAACHLVQVRTKVSERGQVSIPADVRQRLHIGRNTVVEWVIEGSSVRVIPIPEDAIGAFRGSTKPGAVRRLLRDRREDLRKDG